MKTINFIESIFARFRQSGKKVLTRREMLDRLPNTRYWHSEIDEEMMRDIVMKIEMVRTEWDITSAVLPSICRYQLLSDHLKWIKGKESGVIFAADKDPFSEKVGGKTMAFQLAK